jgi:hypothetical protein
MAQRSRSMDSYSSLRWLSYCITSGCSREPNLDKLFELLYRTEDWGALRSKHLTLNRSFEALHLKLFPHNRSTAFMRRLQLACTPSQLKLCGMSLAHDQRRLPPTRMSQWHSGWPGGKAVNMRAFAKADTKQLYGTKYELGDCVAVRGGQRH